MQSRTELNNNQIVHGLNLPRGYFKKRKHLPAYARPPDIARMTRKNSFLRDCVESVHTSYMIIVLILLTTMVTVNATTTIEPDLKVLSLERTVTATPELLSGDGLCKDIDIRLDIAAMEKLRNCRVVEGSVVILLMDDQKEMDFKNYSFPELVEITGYLMMYRISGIKSLNDLFPNLAVIRGRELFKDYSLVIYEMLELEEIGLTNLQTIERGAVRIEKNDQLCFADQIDWTLIAGIGEHYIAKNQKIGYCPVCPADEKNPKPCPRISADQKSMMLCWNQKSCQTKCNCNGGVCTKSGRCCDPKCVGGCDDDDPSSCKACKKLTVLEGDKIVCADSCPVDTFQYLGRRCVSREQCYDFNKSTRTAQEIPPFIPFQNHCARGCPLTFVDFHNGSNMDCKPCGAACQKKCQAKIVDSIAAAQSLKGCSIIEGPLEIQIKSSTRSVESTNNIVKELENSLSDVVEIQDYLKIARSFPIVSLSFLKKLKKIRGNRLESSKYSVVIWDNQNLQELWDENQNVTIENGKLFFHFNPKLCFSKIERLANTSRVQIENLDTARMSNGDKTACNVKPLDVKVAQILPQAALLSWKPLILEDERSLLSYVVFYTPAMNKNITIWDGRDACGNDGWLVDDVNDFDKSDSISFPLTKLEPFTQYAYYVKAYTVATEKTGAQSDISYFRTLPGQPMSVTKPNAIAKSSSTVKITWEPPKKVNGQLSYYMIRAKLLERSYPTHRDYCVTPIESSETALKPEIKPPEPAKSIIEKFGQCDCITCSQTCQKDQKEGDEQRQSANDFEDEIQDFVYVRMDDMDPMKDGRAKRQVAEFPEETDRDQENKKKEIDMVSRNNEDGEVLYFYTNVSSTQTFFELKNLKHYSTYQILLRACREKTNETESLERLDGMERQETLDDLCSQESPLTVTTLKKEENDQIIVFDATNIPSNGSLGTIKVKWEAPLNPNGLLLSYTIRQRRVDIENSKGEHICITHNNFLNQSFYILDAVPNGNYSIQIAATSMAGTGNYTPPKYVLIKENSGNTTLTVVLVLLCVFIILMIALFYIFKRYYLPSISSMKLIANVNPDYAGVHYKQDSWEVPRDKVIQLQELGQGSFGMVYEGIIKDFKVEGGETRCAIKTVNENATDKERISFLNEASVMKQFDTAFVVRLLGIVSTSQPNIFVVMELMANGDLKGYLRSHRPEYDNGTEPPPQPPTLRQILQMAAEIADGMSYLSAKKFVHRDLAARNCMVAEDLTVKIGDFGMTRDIYETDYYRKGTKGLLPVRWMSPESLKDGVFTSSSDVFSYGVVLWEMATLASQPYQGLSNDQVLRYVIDGGVMERPENCPDKLYELMRRCWQHRPSGRPTFMEIIEMLLDDVNQNFRNISFYFTKEGQDAFHQQRQGEYAVNITDDVTTPLRHDEEDTSSIEGNNFLMEDMNSDHKLHDL